MFVKSSKELTKVKTITIIAILISMSVVCDLLKINIYITQELKLSLSFLFLSVFFIIYSNLNERLCSGVIPYFLIAS